MRKSDRLFQLANILRKHQPITAKQLAEKLLVSERTIYRYIDDLSLSGIPIYGEPGVGYRLSEGFELPPLQLSSGELEALVTGVSLTASLTGKNLAASAHSLLSKIEAALPNELKLISNEDRVVRVPVSNHRESEAYQVWEKAHSAIEKKRWLNIVYHSLAEVVTSRTVFPLGLFYWGGRWTLGVWCAMRGEYRDFRIDRIIKLEHGEYPGALPEGVSLSAYIELKNTKVD
ncbi:YafY family protein [Vibrio gazogenes]|uniref:WYL domain-containing protein n=1 Tax=Vibrio gazogenes DSM 21264 = NBRC 103151 TaxID=1123492 RepID=A0A1M5A588_VIBGA|nr:YafY family protein [Vibrio gazogenes]USP13347.1 YafY family transcriptional regulator [Vibrio gazogenes]SHF25448.1 WYL domain-containing protein [Vibrio gazogenes DSM 21264] [Vibrio gazogenes DSM 21264 = NBRC 103151]SJN56995.1 Bifunctional ligase/repressor BirA [Vibrio gazogenes]